MASLGKVWNRTMHLKIEDYICFSVLIIPEFEHELWLTTNGSDKGQATGYGAILAAVSKITEEKLHGEKKRTDKPLSRQWNSFDTFYWNKSSLYVQTNACSFTFSHNRNHPTWNHSLD